MEQKQLINTMAQAIEQALANMHTCTIAKVTAVNETTIDCKPVFNRLVKGQDIELPVFSEVPPITLQGGSSYHAFPIAVGDYCLLFFTERCFDGWYNGQDDVLPLEYRMHDYSDGIAIVGLNNLAGAISIPSVIQQTGDTNQDGNYTHQGNRDQVGDYGLEGDIVHDGDAEQVGDSEQTGNRIINGLLTVNGNFVINGGGGGGTANMNNITINIITGDVIADGISLKNHTHAQGVDSNGDTQQNTGPAQ